MGGRGSEERRVVSDYDATAGIYDSRYLAEQETKIGFLLNRLRPGGGALVLDVGCGTGLLIERLRRDAVAIGIDPSLGMLKEAKRKGCRAELVQADAEHLPVKSCAADYVLSVSALQLLCEPARGAREMLRVLKPGGRIGVSALMKSFTGDALKSLFGIADGEAYDSETMKDAFLIANKN